MSFSLDLLLSPQLVVSVGTLLLRDNTVKKKNAALERGPSKDCLFQRVLSDKSFLNCPFIVLKVVAIFAVIGLCRQ